MDARVGLRHLVPSASTWVEVPHTRARPRAGRRPNAPAASRCTGRAGRSQVRVPTSEPGVGATRGGRGRDRELLAIPSIDAPDFVVDDDPLVVAGFWRGFVTVPPGAASTAPVLTLAIRIVEALGAWSVVCLVVPGRYTGVVARRMTSVVLATAMRRGLPLGLERLLGPGTRTVTVATSRDPNAKVTVLLFRAGAIAAHRWS